ncbi:MAG: hypothetical protein Q7J82_00685 [Coriobacteriia bacterium]|nr:hypothetical protein [Coriobacteriia bacterium]
MSDQYGAYAPPPQVPGQPPRQPAPIGQPPVRKSKTGLIIGIVIGVILLLCGCSAAAGVLFFRAAGDTTVSTISESPAVTDPAQDQRLAEWLAWNPLTTEQFPEAPSADTALILEALKILAPDFVATETGYAGGYIDKVVDYYYGDLYLVSATHPSSDKVAAAIEFTLQSPDMIADGVSFEVGEGDRIDKVTDAMIEMISYGPFGNVDFPIDSAEGEALWQTIGNDWPDAVVMHITTETADQVSVSITKWRQYAIDDYSPRMFAIYQLSNGEWTLIDWEYEALDDVPAEPIDDASVT